MIPNEALRAHVTRTGFDLSLGKTHIAALVYVDACCRRNEHISMRNQSRVWSMFVPAVRGLEERGLVWYKRPPSGPAGGTPFSEVFGLTTAGKLVRGLLKEAGIWAEYEAAIPPVEVAS